MIPWIVKAQGLNLIALMQPPRSFVMVLALVATPTDTSPHTWIFRNDQAVPCVQSDLRIPEAATEVTARSSGLSPPVYNTAYATEPTAFICCLEAASLGFVRQNRLVSIVG
jgi:hypothetical protein